MAESGDKPKVLWADDESSDDEEEVKLLSCAMPLKLLIYYCHYLSTKVELFQEKEGTSDDDSSSSSESGDEEDSVQMQPINNLQEVKKEKQGNKQAIPLSKKERKELREKEMNDLDSILADFRVGVQDNVQPAATDSVVSETIVDTSDNNGTPKKNKKKKKKQSNSSKDATSKVNMEDPPLDVVFDMKKLQERTKKSKKKGESVALKQALKEMEGDKKNEKKKKKKKDKKNYNEMPC